LAFSLNSAVKQASRCRSPLEDTAAGSFLNAASHDALEWNRKKTLKDPQMNTQLLTAIGIILVALIIIILWRTADAPYGKIRPSQKVTEAYERYEVDGNLVYYISGSENYPNAIIGIEKTWNLDLGLWKPMEFSPGNMKELVQNMLNKAAFRRMNLHGFDILDNRGEKIGNCFSVLNAVTTVKITGEKTVAVYTPPLDTYHDS